MVLTSQPEQDEKFASHTFTRKEASELLGFSESTLDAKTRAGEIGACRTGRRVYYLQRHLEEFLKRAEVEQSSHVAARRKSLCRKPASTIKRIRVDATDMRSSRKCQERAAR